MPHGHNQVAGTGYQPGAPGGRGQADTDSPLRQQFQNVFGVDYGPQVEGFLDPLGMTSGPGNIGFSSTPYAVDPSLGHVAGLPAWQQQSGNMMGAANTVLGQQRTRLGGISPQEAEYMAAKASLSQARGAVGQIMGLAGEYGQEAQGLGGPSVAELMMQQTAADLGQQQRSFAAQARGGNAAGALYQAAQQGAQLGASAGQSAAVMRAQEIQQARQNQMAALGQGVSGYGAISGAQAGMSEFDAQQRQNMFQFLEGQAGTYDQAFQQQQLGVSGQQLSGMELDETAKLEAERLKFDATESWQDREARLATSEYEAAAAKDDSILGMLGGAFGI